MFNEIRFVQLDINMVMTATVEVNVWAVFCLPVLVLAVTGSGNAMTFNFGNLNAHARDPTATSGSTNLLMRPMVRVFLKPLFGSLLKDVSSQCSMQVTNGNRLWVIF